jgi:predicted CoA-binding protein
MTEVKKTLVLGASSKPGRVSREAVLKLRAAGHDVVAIGMQEEPLGDVIIQKDKPTPIHDLHTISLYLNPERQKEYYDYLLELKPKRILFNPGTENEELKKLALQHKIETEEACTLVLISLDAY